MSETVLSFGTQQAAEGHLFQRYAEGHLRAREELVALFLPLSRRLASRYSASTETREDLEQVAAMGLLKAIDRYDASAGPFLKYAVPTIVG
jgi:RNA polymerase sigma-B factor